MAFDDPVVWVMIVAIIVFLFGSNKIPEIARAIGQAKKELDMAMKGIQEQTNLAMNAASTSPQVAQRPSVPPGTVIAPAKPGVASAPAAQGPAASPATPPAPIDPLITAAKSEGIDTRGKTRDQIATELAIKLNNSKKS